MSEPPQRRLPALPPGSSTFIGGGYGTGKTSLTKSLIRTVGGGIIWGAPEQDGARVEYSDMAAVAHDLRSLERAAARSPYVVWPSPPRSAGQDAIREAYNEWCGFAMTLRRKAAVTDEFQRLTEDNKRLSDLPPNAQDLAELGHKEPSQLAKVWIAHRLAQIPLVFGDGAIRISTRPFPGDEDALLPFFGKDGVARMKRFRSPREIGGIEFAYWSADTGPILPCLLRPTKGAQRGPGTGPAVNGGQ